MLPALAAVDGAVDWNGEQYANEEGGEGDGRLPAKTADIVDSLKGALRPSRHGTCLDFRKVIHAG